MALSPEQRKKKLGFGGLKRIADQANRTMGHVSQVNSLLRFDQNVRDLITADIVARHPEIGSEDVWPKTQLAMKRATA